MELLNKTVWSEGFLFKVALPDLKISPSIYYSTSISDQNVNKQTLINA